jgi:hypothetical protein
LDRWHQGHRLDFIPRLAAIFNVTLKNLTQQNRNQWQTFWAMKTQQKQQTQKEKKISYTRG